MIEYLPIDLIKPSPNPVRTQWDEEKMNELTQSIKEQGLIVPIKVRPVKNLPQCSWHNFKILGDKSDLDWEGREHLADCLTCNDLLKAVYDIDLDTDEETIRVVPFEIVYGHRRVEACKQAGLTEIEAIIEGIDDVKQLIQALIENIQREDMRDIEIAEAIENIVYISTGFKSATYVNTVSGERIYPNELVDEIKRVAGFLGIAYQQTSRYLAMLKPLRKPIVDTFYEENPSIKDVKTKADWLQQAMPDEDIEIQKAVARKAAREELGQKKVRQVAQSVAAAPTKEAKEKLLEWEFNSEIHNPERIILTLLQ